MIAPVRENVAADGAAGRGHVVSREKRLLAFRAKILQMRPIELARTSRAGEVDQEHGGAGKGQRLEREVQPQLEQPGRKTDKITLLHETVISTRQEVMANPSPTD